MKLLDLLLGAGVVGVAALLLWSSGETPPAAISATRVGGAACAFLSTATGAAVSETSCLSAVDAVQTQSEQELARLARGGLTSDLIHLGRS